MQVSSGFPACVVTRVPPALRVRSVLQAQLAASAMPENADVLVALVISASLVFVDRLVQLANAATSVPPALLVFLEPQVLMGCLANPV